MIHSVKNYHTFKFDHKVASLHVADSLPALKEALSITHNPIILGGGSNVLFTKDCNRDVIVIDLKGIEVIEDSESHVDVSIAGGEDWHNVVMWAIDNNYGGIENLSLIPGKCGAAPMQNIGAYGVEIKDVLLQVQTLNREDYSLIPMSPEQCDLGYRESVFKSTLKNKRIIIGIHLRLTKPGHHQLKLDYGAIKSELEAHHIVRPTIKDVSDAVIKIRNSKLPNPAQLPNAGSFFKNPILPIHQFEKIKNSFPNIPSYPVDDMTIKVPAGWLIDQCGWKGLMLDKVGVHSRQALVLVNHGEKEGSKIVVLSQLIQKSILDKYGISLEPEVNFIGS